MIRQYYAPRFKGGFNPHRVGTVPVGTICRPRIVGRRVIVEAWMNREVTGYGPTTYMAGGHLAQVRDLATGRSFRLADHFILAACDELE